MSAGFRLATLSALAMLFSCGDAGDPPTSAPTTGEPEPSGDMVPVPGPSGQPDAPGPSATGSPAVPPGNTGSDTPGVEPPPPTSTPATPPVLACDEAKVGAPTLRLLTRAELENSLRDIFPEVAGQWSNALPSNTLSVHGFENDAGGTVGQQLAEGMLETAEAVATAVTGGSLANVLPCSVNAPDRSCAASFVETYGRRLFRRPLNAAEQERYLGFFDSAASQTDFSTALKWVLVGLIQSPHAVYRSEIGQVAGDTRALTAFETATELAYTFTGTTPSEELLARAEQGDLGDLAEQARQMLQTSAGRETLHRFFEAYTGYPRSQAKAKPNASNNGVQYADVRSDMVRETRSFIDSVLFEHGGGVGELLTSALTYPSTRLASFYGIDQPASDHSAVERAAGQGIGLLAQGSFLASHANSDASSPTQRGVFVFTKMLCQPKPPLPDNVPQLPDVQPDVQTTRQRYEDSHSAQEGCAGCHLLFDPIGFAFEHYDEAGRYRSMEGTLPIDASGTYNLPSGTELSFQGLEELAQGLAEDPVVQECVAAYLATYAFGTSEGCLGASQVAALQAGEIGLVEAFARLAAEPHFTQRRVR